MDIPKEIQIEPTINCNLDCIMCNKNARERGSKNMTFDEFKIILNQFPDLKKIHLHGIGEPFLNKDLLNMIHFAKQKGIIVCFNSNFTLITKDIAQQLINLGLDEIRFSLDADNKIDYEKIRKKDLFEDTLKNLEIFSKLKKESKKDNPKIILVVVAMKDNLNQIKNIIRLGAERSVDLIVVQNMQSWSTDEDLNERDERDEQISTKKIDKEILEAEFNNIKKISNELGIKVVLPPLEKGHFTCLWPWHSVFISVEGYVTPCCNCPDPRVYNFGNLFKDSMEKIWNSDKYNKFRLALKSDNIPSICKGCIILSGELKDYSSLK